MMNWLFLRGLAREQRHWHEFPDLLESSIPDNRVFHLDLPGVGTEQERLSPTTVDSIVEDLRRRWLLLKENTGADWNLLAISLGGMLGMRWCEKYPQDFKKLVLINSSAADLSPVFHRIKFQALLKILKAGFTHGLKKKEFDLLNLTTSLRKDLDSLSSLWAQWAQERPIRRDTALRQLMAASLFRAPARLETPVLILSSKGDLICHPCCSEALAKHFRAEHRIHPQAGHDLPLDDSQWVIDQLIEKKIP